MNKKDVLVGFGLGVVTTGVGIFINKKVKETIEKRKEPVLHPVNELLFETEHDATIVLDVLKKTIVDFDQVSVQDYYDVAGVESEFKDSKFGWVNLDKAKVVKVKGNFSIKLPKVQELK